MRQFNREEWRLWFSLFAPAVAWIVAQQASFLLTPWICETVVDGEDFWVAGPDGAALGLERLEELEGPVGRWRGEGLGANAAPLHGGGRALAWNLLPRRDSCLRDPRSRAPALRLR